MRTKLLIIGLAAALAACGGDDTTCGTGTTKMGGQCVASGGSGGDTTCGTGTHLMGTMCVPDDTTVAAAPTISMMDPTEAGISGGGLFTITGTGFNGSNVTDLHVFFGDPSDTNCEATLGAASATMVSGEIPFGCTFSPSVTVTVQTNVGSATTPFNYDMIFAGEGDAGGDLNGDGGDVYLIDPFAAQSYDLGTLGDGSGNAFAYGGMDFNTTGLLFATTTGDSPSDAALTVATSQLISIDISTGMPTIVGPVTDDAGTAYFVQDIKFDGGTLYGWAVWDTDGQQTFGAGLISIDTTTAAATQIGTPNTTSFFFGAMALDASNNLLVAPNGAGSDDTFGTTGELDTVDTGTGSASVTAQLDWPVGAPVTAMTTFPGAMPLILGVIDNGTYGAFSGAPLANETLAVIDPAAGSGASVVSPAFELPGPIGSQPRIDAMAIPPSTLVLQRKLPRTGWTKLKRVEGGRVLTHRHF